MKTLTNILFATDFSERSLNAEQRIGLLPLQDCHLNLLHVLSSSLMRELRRLISSDRMDTRLQESVRQQLKTQAERLSALPNLTTSFKLGIGRPHSVVISEAKTMQSLIVIGSHGRHAVRDWFEGSMVERILNEAEQPLLVVKQPARERYQRVLIPVDFSSSSLAAIQAAMTIAPQAELTLLNVFQIPFENKLRFAGISEAELDSYRSSSKQQAERDMKALINQITNWVEAPNIKIEDGHAPEVILLQADELACDLIVMGRYGKSDMAHLLLGSVTEYVSTLCDCDVLVVSEG